MAQKFDSSKWSLCAQLYAEQRHARRSDDIAEELKQFLSTRGQVCLLSISAPSLCRALRAFMEIKNLDEGL